MINVAKSTQIFFEKLEENPQYSPYDSSKDEYKYFALDDFKEGNGNYWWTKNQFISEYYAKGNKRVFKFLKQDDGLYIVCEKQTLQDYWRTENYVEVTDIFPTASKMVKLNRYPYNDIEEKHMIPVTVEQIFETMKPMYIQKYLANGREYEKEYDIK